MGKLRDKVLDASMISQIITGMNLKVMEKEE